MLSLRARGEGGSGNRIFCVRAAVPGIRYFHTGKIWKLNDAVKVMGTAQLGGKLSDEEPDRITAFLMTLDGRQPKVEYAVLPEGSDPTPRPVLK